MHTIKAGTPIILYIGSDSYQETVTKVTKKGIIYVKNKHQTLKFKLLWQNDEMGTEKQIFHQVGGTGCYAIRNNTN